VTSAHKKRKEWHNTGWLKSCQQLTFFWATL